MASIVYDGVPGNGDLFAGIKFFIMQRVPLRNTWVDNIKSNGGEVVPLENQADMLIADRARPKMAPPNSFTWQYIEDSLKSGVLQDMGNYRIHSVSSSHASPMARTTGNVVGGSRPNKTTRTPYTQGDDEFLLQWAAKAQQRGMALLGKKIYEQLATVNPRHTAQSWQDRYKKQHQGKQLPEVSLDGPAPVDEPENGQLPRPLGSRQVDGVDDRSRRVSELDRHQLSRSRANRHVVEAEDDQDADEDEERHPPVVERFARHAPKVVAGQEFSQADHDLLASEYEAILDIEQKGKSVIQAWSGFSKGHGRHTADEWYNYFQTTVKPQMERKLRKAVESKKTKWPVITMEEVDKEDVEEQPSLGKKPPHSAASKKSNSSHRAVEKYEVWNERRESMFVESERDSEESHQADDDEDMKAIDLGMSQQRDDEVPVPALRTKSPYVSSIPKSPALRKPSSISKQSRDLANNRRDESLPEDKAAFLEDLRTVARATHKQIEPRQEVCGIEIQLYDLWNAVNNKFEGFEHVDAGNMWGRVATHLGFIISKHPDVAQELRSLYAALLVKVRGTGAMPEGGTPKTALVRVHPSTGKSLKPVAAVSASIPGASLPSRTAPIRTTAVKSQARSLPAPPRDTSKLLQPRKVAKSAPLTNNANAAMTIRSLPEVAASTASAEADTLESVASVDDLEPAESQVPMQLETGNGYVQSSKEHVEGADEESFTEADWVMLAKLVDFANDSLNMNIQRTGSAVCGRWVSLPKFRKVVNRFGGYNTVTRKNLWKQVSFDLGYLPVNKYPDVAKELQEAYEEVLEDYDEYRKRVREVRRSSGHQELRSLSDENYGIAVPRTSPRHSGSVSSQKRGRYPSKDDSPAKVADTFKRRRVDRKGKGKEIGSEVPGTPEHIYNSSMLSQEASVVKDSQIIELSSDWDSDGTEAFQPMKRPLFQKAAGPPESLAAEEPETQEFSFIEEECPSRQLNSEAMASESGGDPVVIEYFEMCDSEGYPREVAQLALAAANMNTVLASKIISRVARGRIPDNISGVWTAKDDDTLLMDLPIDHPGIKNLIKKHGSDGIEERREFLDDLGEYAADG